MDDDDRIAWLLRIWSAAMMALILVTRFPRTHWVDRLSSNTGGVLWALRILTVSDRALSEVVFPANYKLR